MSPPTASTTSPATEANKGIKDITRSFMAKTKIDQGNQDTYKYDYLKPVFPDISYPPLEVFETRDKALDADPSYKNLFAACEKVEHCSPKIGTILYGIDATTLSDAAKDELALLISYRVVVFLKNQKNLDIHKHLDLGRHWGTLHKHATTSQPKAWNDKELEEVHVVWADETRPPVYAFSPTYMWHSDVTYELQPPSYTALKVIDSPQVGGDTGWCSGYAIYDMLSPRLRTYLEGMTALHDAHEQAQGSREIGRPVRREPIVSEHPVIRTHPVTGYKSVFVNPGFTRAIVGVPKFESDAILQYIFNLIATTMEAQVRHRWGIDDVAIWDNRVSTHSVVPGIYPARRHAVRVTVHGEKPYYDPNGKSQQDELDAEIGFERNMDGTAQANYND